MTTTPGLHRAREGSGGPGARHRRPTDVVVGAAGLGALVLTAVGLGGIGDAPDPHAGAGQIAGWFTDRRDDVLLAAPFGHLGAVAIVIFTIALGRRLRDRGAAIAGGMTAAGGVLVALYLVVAHILWTAIAYEPSASAKGLFVLSVVAVPVLGLGLTITFAGVAIERGRTGLLPRWLRGLSAVGAVATVPALAPIGDEGLLSPDLQQQLCGNALLLWLLVTSTTIAVTRKDTP